MADFLVALAEFDRGNGWKELGYSSLFHFLHRELGLSKGAAHYRKTAADLIQRFPEIIEPLRDGRLCITSVVYLDKVLTLENRCETLPKFFQRSRRESIAIAAALRPADVVPQPPNHRGAVQFGVDHHARPDDTSATGEAQQRGELGLPLGGCPTRDPGKLVLQQSRQ